MKSKHKLLQDFQFTSSEKKIFVLKTGTILEEYVFKSKDGEILIDKDIVDNNPLFFQVIDWTTELLIHLKTQKVPQPSQVHKKLVPFIEDMILSSIQSQSTPVAVIDESMVKDLEKKESDLKSRERRIKDKEDEIEIRLKRVEKREDEYKEDLSVLEKKESSIREKLREISGIESEVDQKTQELKEVERNIDRTKLESGKDIDIKYIELQRKIDKDLRALSEREKDIDVKLAELRKRESKVSERDNVVDDVIRQFELKIGDIKIWETELRKLDSEIRDWESLTWQLKRTVTPPSAINPSEWKDKCPSGIITWVYPPNT
jgi:myosin heavy subunit